jgi:hypothetical protein
VLKESGANVTCGTSLPGRHAHLRLRGLLIKVFGLIGELDGHQGLDVGVEVEGVTGPAGSDGFGVLMLETNHRCIPIRSRLWLAAFARRRDAGLGSHHSP